MNNLLNIDLLFVGIALAANGILGFTAFLSNKKSITNRAFLFFVLSSIPWGIFNYFIFQSGFPNIAIWILRGHVFFSVWYCFFLFRLFYVFPEENKSFFKVYYFFILPVTILTSLLTLTPFVFERIIKFSSNGGVQSVSNGPGIIIFGVTVVSLIAYAVYLLSRKLINAKGIEKKEFELLLAGITITFFLHIVFNFIFPALLNNPQFAPLGSLFIFPFIIFTSYAILKHKLFNIRVAGASVLIFFLAIMSFIDIIQTSDVAQIILRSATLVTVLIFSILLLKSIVKETEQKEKIEKIEKELEKAYTVEKRANDELKQLDVVKNQFLMTIQHHLRTPLTSMRGYAELLLGGTFGKVPKKIEDVIKRFEISTTSLIKMVNDFLDVTQFQMGKGVVAMKEGVNLSSILDDVLADIKLEGEKKGIRLTLEKPHENCIIEADESKLRAAIVNVFDNSVKYTQQGSVAMKLIVEGGWAKIEIKDTGMGIAKERLPKLFNSALERTEEAKKAFVTGRGIGLYLAGQIVTAHHGKIWAESPGEGKGSTFNIELPIKQEAKTVVSAIVEKPVEK